MEDMCPVDIEPQENLASFFEKWEPDEKRRAELLKVVAPRILLAGVCEIIVSALGFQRNDGASERIAQSNENPVNALEAWVIYRANGSERKFPLYSILDHVATHLREVCMGMSPPNWEIIRHAYIETKHMTAWESALREAMNPNSLAQSKAGPADGKSMQQSASTGITKIQALTAFGGLVEIDLAGALEDGKKWVEPARLSRGKKGGRHVSMWNPVLLAIALREHKSVPKFKLNQTFFAHDFLSGWREEWQEHSKELP